MIDPELHKVMTKAGLKLDRRGVYTYQDDNTTQVSVPLPCGCIFTMNHDRGDRLFECGHGRKWVSRARQPTEVVYDVEEIVE